MGCSGNRPLPFWREVCSSCSQAPAALAQASSPVQRSAVADTGISTAGWYRRHDDRRGRLPEGRRHRRGGLRHQRLLQRRSEDRLGHRSGHARSSEITNSAREESSARPSVFRRRQPALPRVPERRTRTSRRRRAFNPTFSASLGYNSGGQSVALSDQFTRLQDPPYEPGLSPITRDFNVAVLQAGLAPGGGRIQITPRYTNTLDIFEGDDFAFGNRMGHDGLHRHLVAVVAEDLDLPPARCRLHPIPQRGRRGRRESSTRFPTGRWSVSAVS